MKSNHQFCSICEIVGEDGSSAGPQKACIFYANHFLYVLQKKFRNKLCLESHDTNALFRTFFSQVYNKQFFLEHLKGAGSDDLSSDTCCKNKHH